MEQEQELPSAGEVVRHYLAIVLAVNGELAKHWGFARVLHYAARRALEHYYFHQQLSPTQEAELFGALEQLHMCPVKQRDVPGAWQQVQETLRHAMPLVQQILAE